MSENIYKEAFEYAMEELHKQYIEQEKESEFIFNFNVNYVEDTIDTITVSVASLFMKTQVTTKGSLKIIENKLKEITVKVSAKGGENNGKMFGSVTSEMISNALKDLGFDVDKKKIEIKDSIRDFGEFEVVLRLYSEVTQTLKIQVVRA